MQELIIAECQERYPEEAVGLVMDNDDVVILTNVSSTPEKSFEVDSLELYMKTIGLGRIRAVWHSHPGGRITPSDDDWDWHPGDGIELWIVADGEIYEYASVTA